MRRKKTKAEMRAYQREWARENRKKNRDKLRSYLNQRWRAVRNAWLLLNGPCAQCQSWERLEVDHKDPKTKTHHSVWTWAEDRRNDELAKCQVLCFVCHRLKTNAERGWKIHGELMYQRGCRCEECERVHAKKLRKLAREAH